MKSFKYLLLAFLFANSCTSLAQNKILPAAELKTLEGEPVNIQDYASNGKITVLSFWATWCIPCQNELDAIAKLYPSWQKDYDMELVAITIDTRRALTRVKPLLEKKLWDYIVLSDADQSLQQALDFQAIPQTFVLDKAGKIVYSHSGYEAGDEKELEEKIKSLVGG